MNARIVDRALAVAAGLACHLLFALAVGSMAFALATGLQHGRGPFVGAAAVVTDLLLVLQFPLLHSFLLGRRGRTWLARALPGPRGRTLAVTTYAVSASLQLLLAFWCWSPSGVVWHAPSGALGALQWSLFVAAWLFLQKAIWDAGLGTQTGFAGWWALLRGRAVDYGSMPTGGLFARCRQPIYLGFALVLWTAPVWSFDWLLLASGWTVYCVLGPLHKERRWAERYGAEFAAYRARVPYFVPRREVTR